MVQDLKGKQAVQRIPNNICFLGSTICLFWRPGFGVLKQTVFLGLKTCPGCKMPKITIRIEGKYRSEWQNWRMPLGTLCPGSQLVIQEIKILFTLNSKLEFVPRDQVFPLIFVYCLLLLPNYYIVPHSFYLLIFYSEKFPTWIWHLLSLYYE